MKPKKPSYFWLIAGLITLSLKILSSYSPELVENLYSRRAYLGIRMLFDVVSWFPFALMYLFWFWVIRFMVRKIRSRRTWTWAGSLAAVLNFVGFWVFTFFVLWGFHYSRVPVEKTMHLALKPLDGKALAAAFAAQTEKIIQLRDAIPGADATALTRSDFPADLEKELRTELKSCLDSHHYPTVGRVRGRLLWPRGVFLRFSSAGLYWPFTGEGHIDPGLDPIQWPYVMSHEMSHGYGFADEGTCNFWAYLSCEQSKNSAIRYSGNLNYWRTLAAQYRRYYRDEFVKIRESLPKGIQADLDAINTAMLKYPDFIPDLQPRLYDAYLKSQGISEGMLNYDRVTMLVVAYEAKNGVK
jgi:hypothetical protein